MARVTVSDLRNEARRKLKECSGGKTISRMNRTELIRFLQCIDDRALADTYDRFPEVADLFFVFNASPRADIQLYYTRSARAVANF